MNSNSSSCARPAGRARSSVLARFGALAASGTLALGLGFAALLAGPASPAQAHDQLINTVIETTDAGEASAIRLTYSNNIIAVGTEVLVTDSAGDDVAPKDPEVVGADVIQQLDSGLADDTYTAVWRVVSSDGHPIDGGFTFDVLDGAPGEVVALDPASLTKSDDAEPSASDSGATAGESSRPSWVISLSIGAVVVVIVAVAIPVVLRSRKGSGAQASTDGEG